MSDHEQCNYIPVGSRLSREQIAAMPMLFLRERSIYDPRYAGFEEHFDWRNYVQLELHDPETLREVTAALDQFARTPEGQHILRQSLAMQTFRNTGAVPMDLTQVARHRIRIADWRYGRRWGSHNDDGSGFSMHENAIYIDMNEIRRCELLGQDGQYHDMTVQDTLFHELSHAADGLNTRSQQQYLQVTHGASYEIERRTQHRERHPDIAANYNRLLQLREYSLSPIEYPAIHMANDFMSMYYAAPARAMTHSDYRDDPRAEGHFFYEQLAHLPSPRTPPVVLTAQRQR